MAITPDTKDWTWVLQRPCPECGFDTQGFPVEAVPGMIMANVAAWQAALDGADDARARPEPAKWSPVEYACHVRDVFRLYDQRLELMLGQDDPLFPNWDQDETAVADRYAEQDPAEELNRTDRCQPALLVHGIACLEVAAQKGLRSGDVILEAAGRPVSRPAEISSALDAAKKDGRKAVLLRVKSGDQTRFVALATNPAS